MVSVGSMNEEVSQSGPKSGWQAFKETKIGTFCTDPAVAFFVGVLGIVIGLGGGFYFYKISTKTRDLSYYVNPNITTIVQPSTLSDLAVSYQGQPITNGFYGQQLAIWNEGKEAIETKDILQQIVIRPPAGVHVLQIKVVKRSRELTGFQIASNTTPDAIALTWNILEYRDGGVIQIFYTGNPNDKFTIDGALREQPKVRELQVTISKRKGITALGSIFAVGSSIFFFLTVYVAITGRRKELRLSLYNLVLLFGFIFIIASLIWSLNALLGYWLQQPVPFGL